MELVGTAGQLCSVWWCQGYRSSRSKGQEFQGPHVCKSHHFPELQLHDWDIYLFQIESHLLYLNKVISCSNFFMVWSLDREVLTQRRCLSLQVRLAVAGAFHTRFMGPAVQQLEAALANTEIRTPRIPVISNVDAAPHSDPATIKRILAQQVIFRFHTCYVPHGCQMLLSGEIFHAKIRKLTFVPEETQNFCFKHSKLNYSPILHLHTKWYSSLLWLTIDPCGTRANSWHYFIGAGC